MIPTTMATASRPNVTIVFIVTSPSTKPGERSYL